MIVKTFEGSIVRITLLRPPPLKKGLYFSLLLKNKTIFSQQHEGIINKDTYTESFSRRQFYQI